MINLNNLGYHSDCIARKIEGEFTETDTYFVLRMPKNPTFHWGNLIVFRAEPRKYDFDAWISAFKNEFGEESSHIALGWETQEIGNIDDFIQAGFSLKSQSVLVLDELEEIQISRNDLVIRKIESDADWKKVLELQIYISEGENPSKDYVDFKVRDFETYRALSENGDGNWWGVFLGEKLVGDMGLYFDNSLETGRFQSVETHPDYRRMGVCSKLLYWVSSDALRKNPRIKLVICTERDSDAERIYRKLGFVRHQAQHGVCLPGKLKISSNKSAPTTSAIVLR
ncbi:MAG: GNAT family N-acetyltransferase [Opitutales bacterium]|nr:GNAT family N-acetyltransferase [Opitutales bacterium]